MGNIILFLLETSFTILGAAFLARCWLHSVRFHPFNPFSQLIFRVTDWLVKPLRSILPTPKTFDLASLLGAYVIAFVYSLTIWMVSMRAVIPLDIIAPALGTAGMTLCRWALNLIIWLTLIQAVLSWVNPMAPVMPVLRTLTAPMLEPIRRIMPNLGGVDLSPLVLLIMAQVAMMVVNQISFTMFGM
jgi:YggT family protein|tara:strand:+ start:382 stop:942 length:561 start_codon:yes stop_codon:yes gene_type:complete